MDHYEKTAAGLLKGELKQRVEALRRQLVTSIHSSYNAQASLTKSIISMRKKLIAVNEMIASVLLETPFPSYTDPSSKVMKQVAESIHQLTAVDKKVLLKLYDQRRELNDTLQKKSLSTRKRTQLIEKIAIAGTTIEANLNNKIPFREFLQIMSSNESRLSKRYASALALYGQSVAEPLRELLQTRFYPAIQTAERLLPNADTIKLIGRNFEQLNQALKTAIKSQQSKNEAFLCTLNFSDANRRMAQVENNRKAFADHLTLSNKIIESQHKYIQRENSLLQHVACNEAITESRNALVEKVNVNFVVNGAEYRTLEGNNQRKSAMTGAVRSSFDIKVTRREYLDYQQAIAQNNTSRKEELLQKWARDNADKIPVLDAKGVYTSRDSHPYRAHVEWHINHTAAYPGEERTYRTESGVHASLADTLATLKIAESITGTSPTLRTIEASTAANGVFLGSDLNSTSEA
ncbi:hypothetical protein SC206_14780 [Rouxiella sp. T17]|uniref:hypothetical protein n=1 Tax=Rouxiella sp. T17 TaxID=3085684 RepID=UPI002FC8B9AB